MRFSEIRNFNDWLEYQKEYKKVDQKIAIGFLICVLLFGAFVIGIVVEAGATASVLVETKGHTEIAACSAIGMVHVDGFCIDDFGNQHRLLIAEDGRAFIDGNRKLVIC